MEPIYATKGALRRFLLEKQQLLHPRPERPMGNAEGERQHVMDVIRQLECVQIDPVAAVRPNQHLALAARIKGYEPSVLNELLRGGEVFEYFANAACIIPMEDYPVFEPVRRRMRERIKPALEELEPVAKQVMDKLEREGPLPSKAFESDRKVHGYWDNVNAKTKATSHALNLLADSAWIRIVGREGNQRLFDVTARSVPSGLLASAERMDAEEANRSLLFKYFRAYRVFDPSDPRFGWQRLSAAERRDTLRQCVDAGMVAAIEVEGVRQPYYVLAEDLDRLSAHCNERVSESGESEGWEGVPISFLPPLDNLLWSRKRLEDLFEFEYRWEIYTPAVKRKYGYYAMPILAGDRLIGRMDPRMDHKERRLAVRLLQIDRGIEADDRHRERLRGALDSFAKAHGADTVTIDKFDAG